jgi:head-tail adaptor
MKRKPRQVGAGALDQSITIVRVTETKDDFGNPERTEQTVGTVRAEVEPTRGQETVIADRQRGVQSYRVTARNQGVWQAVTARDVLVWGPTRLNVRSAPDAGRALYRTVEAEAGVEG